MSKISLEVLGLFVMNLLHAADCIHSMLIAQGLAVSAIALVNTGEIGIALWLIALFPGFIFFGFRAILHAWKHTHHEISRMKVNRSPNLNSPPTQSEPSASP